MSTVWEVRYWDPAQRREVSAEFDERSSARAYARDLVGAGMEQATLIKWLVEPNLPWAKPDVVYRSCAMSVFTDQWYDCAIHEPSYSRWVSEDQS